MKRCHHPASILNWNSKDEVFVCRRCGQVIFPTSVATPDDEFAEWDESLCWHCGGTGVDDPNFDGWDDEGWTPCVACNGQGYVSEEKET